MLLGAGRGHSEVRGLKWETAGQMAEVGLAYGTIGGGQCRAVSS